MSTDPETPPDPAGSPPLDPPGPPSEQVARRGFLQSFSRDAVRSAAQVASIATGLQRATTEAIGAAIGAATPSDATDPAGMAAAPVLEMAPPEAPAVATGHEQPYRIDGETLWLLDQLRYPAAVQEIACTTVGDVSAAMLARRVSGGPLLAEVTAYGIWLAVIGARGSASAMRRTRIRTTGAALRGTRANVAAIDWATAEMLAAWDAEAAETDDALALEAAVRTAADRLAARVTADLTEASLIGAAALSDGMDSTSSIELLIAGATGRPGGVAAGGGAGVAAALAADGHPVRAWVLETRPLDEASRGAAWNLAQAGVETSLVADTAVARILADRPIAALLLEADRIGPDGTVTATVGSSGAAALARRHDVPCLVVAPRWTIDPTLEGEAATYADLEPWSVVDPARVASVRVATEVGGRGALQDLTPPDLVDGIVTEIGVLLPPFDASITAALEATPRRG